MALADGGIIAENRGTGIQVIQAALREALMPPAEFKNDLTQFTVVFRRRRVAQAEQYTTALEAVRAILADRESASTKEPRPSHGTEQNLCTELPEFTD